MGSRAGAAAKRRPDPAPAPSMAPVQQTLARPGRPLEAPVQAGMEARLGHDFSRVRVHTDAGAAASAQAVDAQAYTVGSDVVFGAGSYAPQTSGGASLLAHELAHTVQQRDAAPAAELSVAPPDSPAEHHADRAATGERGAATSAPAATATLMRRTVADQIAGLFAGDTFPKADLDTYLAGIDKSGTIEDFNESDNKARAIVAMWTKDRSTFALTPKLKALLIQEMLSGPTFDDDELAILALLNTADLADLTYIFGAGGVTPGRLDDDINGAENDQLRVFLTSWFDGTIDDIIAGKGTLKAQRTLSNPYDTTSLDFLLDDRARTIAAGIAGIADPNDRDLKLRQLAQPAGDELAAEIAKLTGADQKKAVQDMTQERVTRDDAFEQAQRDATAEHEKETSDPANAAAHKAAADRITADNELRWASLVVLDVALSGTNAAVALKTNRFDLSTDVTPLSTDQQTAAQEAIKTTVVATPPGVPPPAFAETVDGLNYKDKIKARAPLVVDELWNQIAKNRTAAEHVPANLHKLAEMETISNAAADEVDLVFGDYAKAPPLTADVFDAFGNLVTPGTIHDVWQSEQAQKLADATYPARSAEFWMFYLLQNDDEVKAINFKHNARPSLDSSRKGVNTEGKELEDAARAELAIAAEVDRLFEIGRGWDAYNQKGSVSVQLFKGTTDDADRTFLWDMFFTLMHEYLHSLAHKDYNDYAERLGGEATDEGNTLIEGVDSYLTEIVWTHALPRASLPAVRNKVEPDYVARGLPFNASLLPAMPNRRYTNYDKAAKLVNVVGIKNLYAAYFLGEIKAIGGTP